MQARDATGAELDRLVAAVAGSLEEDDPRSAFERRRCVRSEGNGGTSRLKVDMPTDMVATIAAAVEVVATQMVDEAVSGSDRPRREVIAERGGLGAIRELLDDLDPTRGHAQSMFDSLEALAKLLGPFLR